MSDNNLSPEENVEPSLEALKLIGSRLTDMGSGAAKLIDWAVEQIEENDASFDLRWNADQRAIKRWQAEKPNRRALTWPDHADLVVWLLGQLETQQQLPPENARALLDQAIDAMLAFHQEQVPSDDFERTEAPAEALRIFVDALAALLYARHRLSPETDAPPSDVQERIQAAYERGFDAGCIRAENCQPPAETREYLWCDCDGQCAHEDGRLPRNGGGCRRVVSETTNVQPTGE